MVLWSGGLCQSVVQLGCYSILVVTSLWLSVLWALAVPDCVCDVAVLGWYFSYLRFEWHYFTFAFCFGMG